MGGLTEAEAGNVAAYTVGLRPSTEHAWTLRQIDHLVFLRWLARTGRVPDMAAPEIRIARVDFGRIHKVTLLDGRVQSFEGCNLDDAVAYEVLDAIPDSAESSDLCQRCWPPRASDIDAAGA